MYGLHPTLRKLFQIVRCTSQLVPLLGVRCTVFPQKLYKRAGTSMACTACVIVRMLPGAQPVGRSRHAASRKPCSPSRWRTASCHPQALPSCIFQRRFAKSHGRCAHLVNANAMPDTGCSQVRAGRRLYCAMNTHGYVA